MNNLTNTQKETLQNLIEQAQKITQQPTKPTTQQLSVFLQQIVNQAPIIPILRKQHNIPEIQNTINNANAAPCNPAKTTAINTSCSSCGGAARTNTTITPKCTNQAIITKAQEQQQEFIPKILQTLQNIQEGKIKITLIIT